MPWLFALAFLLAGRHLQAQCQAVAETPTSRYLAQGLVCHFTSGALAWLFDFSRVSTRLDR